MGILDILNTKGKMKTGRHFALAVEWTEIQRRLREELTFTQFLDVIKPVLEYFMESEK